jgi:hypothetical protein
MLAGHYAQARNILAAITNADCLKLKSNLLETIKARETEQNPTSR